MNTVSNTQHDIKHRDTPNDKIFTPKGLVKLHLNEIKMLYRWNEWQFTANTILDPCKGDGAYFNMFSKYFKEVNEDYFAYCEIEEGRDFFKYENQELEGGIIVGNLPFSLTDKFLEKSVSLKPRVISYLMPIYALTPARMEFMKKNKYKLERIKQFKWFVCMGMCAFVTWKYDKTPYSAKVTFSYDRTVWYTIDKWNEKKEKQRKAIAKKAASEGKKKQGKKWWRESQENFSKVPTHLINLEKFNDGELHFNDISMFYKWEYAKGKQAFRRYWTVPQKYKEDVIKSVMWRIKTNKKYKGEPL